MAFSVARSAVRTEAKTLHSDLDAVRGSSHIARIPANPSLGRDAFKETKTALGRSQKALAIDAGVAESVLSEALNGIGRNFDVDWVLNQDNTFVATWIRHIEAAKGLTPATRKRIKAERMALLFDLLMQDDEEVA